MLAYIRFIKVSYSYPDAKFALLTEIWNLEDIQKDYSPILIGFAKWIDKYIIVIRALNFWHRWRIHRFLFMSDIEKEQMELLCHEMNLSNTIKLQTTAKWLTNEKYLEKKLESRAGKDFAIVIIVRKKCKSPKLFFNKLRLRRIFEVVEKYCNLGRAQYVRPAHVLISTDFKLQKKTCTMHYLWRRT